MRKKIISIIAPVYNEEKNISLFWKRLEETTQKFKGKYDFEYIFVDDGSGDGSYLILKQLEKNHRALKTIQFTRNFGKEMATTAGLNHCQGDAGILIDADLQHPPELIGQFIQKWEKGAEVVVGVRKKNKGEGILKRYGSRLFYQIINKIIDIAFIPGGTDFRLLDRLVIDEFNRLSEQNRMTRALINWLGFKKEFVYFDAAKRTGGKPGYNIFTLIRLAFSSFISLSLFPLRFAGYLGIFITVISALSGLFLIIEQFLLHDPWHLHFSGTAMLAVLVVFLVGIILICLGLIALYIAHIHREVINRPMYVIRKSKCKNQTSK